MHHGRPEPAGRLCLWGHHQMTGFIREKDRPEGGTSLRSASFGQPVKEPLLSRGESGGSVAICGKISAYQPENGVPPAPICQLFQIHGSIFQPDPSGDGGQALVRAGLDMVPVNENRSFFLTGAKNHPCQAVIGNRSFSTPKITRDAAAAMSQTKQVFRSRRASF